MRDGQSRALEQFQLRGVLYDLWISRERRPGHQQMSGVQIGLAPLGVIAGRVIDPSGAPLGKALVQVLGFYWHRGTLRTYGQSGARTDDFGQYRILNVRPGKYDVVVQPVGMVARSNAQARSEKLDIRPVRTYYPSALSPGFTSCALQFRPNGRE